MTSPSDPDRLQLALARDVALVLFEFLSRVMDECDGEPIDPAIDHHAEVPALWALLGALESSLDEPFASDDRARLKAARIAVLQRLSKRDA